MSPFQEHAYFFFFFFGERVSMCVRMKGRGVKGENPKAGYMHSVEPDTGLDVRILRS